MEQYLHISTKDKLLAVVLDCFLRQRLEPILNSQTGTPATDSVTSDSAKTHNMCCVRLYIVCAGIEDMLLNHRTTDLSRLYRLLSRVEKVEPVGDALAIFIQRKGDEIIAKREERLKVCLMFDFRCFNVCIHQ